MEKVYVSLCRERENLQQCYSLYLDFVVGITSVWRHIEHSAGIELGKLFPTYALRVVLFHAKFEIFILIEGEERVLAGTISCHNLCN